MMIQAVLTIFSGPWPGKALLVKGLCPAELKDFRSTRLHACEGQGIFSERRSLLKEWKENLVETWLIDVE